MLIERGVQALAADREALEREVGVSQAAEAIAALRDLPAVLQGLDELAWREDVAPRDRAAFTVVMSYGMKTENRVPSIGTRQLIGVLDDAYLAFHAAASVGSRTYCPGVMTGVIIYVPLSVLLAGLAMREDLVASSQLPAMLAVALAFHTLEVGHNVFKRW